MKPILLLAFALLMTAVAHAELFIGPTSETNRLVIAENEVILIHTARYATWETRYLVTSNAAHAFTFNHFAKPPSPIPYALAGPAELVSTKQFFVLVFDRVRNMKAHMVISPDSTNAPPDVVVPAGRRIQFFRFFVNNSQDGVSAERIAASGQVFPQFEIYSGDLFEGPITLRFPQRGYLLTSYWFVDEAMQNPQLLPGGPQVWTEKSADMTNWVPVSTMRCGIGSNDFYRLRITK